MVCVGYAKLLEILLNKVGIESYDYSVSVDTSYDDGFTLEEKNVKAGGHARLIVNLIDEKYDVSGYYIADPTWDNNLDKDYLNYSLMTFEEEENTKRMVWNNVESYILGGKDFSDYANRLNQYMINRQRKNTLFPDKNYKESYNRLALKILDIFKGLDKDYYSYLNNKYLKTDIIKVHDTLKFNESNYQDFLTEIGNYILTKTNKKIHGSKLIEADAIGKQALGQIVNVEEYIEKVSNENKNRDEKAFPFENGDEIWNISSDNKFRTR